jgi:hypothetical protein
MKRREFIGFVGGAAAWPLAARAQRAGKIPRIGVLWHAGSPAEEAIYLAALRQGLADFGYVESKNIVVEHRFPAEMPERFRSMAAELAELNLDVLVAAGQPPRLQHLPNNKSVRSLSSTTRSSTAETITSSPRRLTTPYLQFLHGASSSWPVALRAMV